MGRNGEQVIRSGKGGIKCKAGRFNSAIEHEFLHGRVIRKR